MNTAPIVEDMVAIIERYGEWRETFTISYLEGTTTKEHGLRDLRRTHSDTTLLEKRKWRKGKERLLYWGVSYGTVIGQLFATLHPDRVSRLLLDAVVDPSKYLHSTWDAPIEGADVVFDKFFTFCASSLKCPLSYHNESSLRGWFDGLLSSLKKSPVIVPATNQHSADIITLSDVLCEIKESVYCPVQKYPYLGDILLNLQEGNGTILAIKKQKGLLGLDPDDYERYKCIPGEAFSPHCHMAGSWEDEALPGISCADMAVLENFTNPEFNSLAQTLQQLSWVLGNYWTELQIPCVGWSFRASWKYNGI